MSIITSHWELKLVALVLAIALWIYTSGQVRSDRTFDVQFRDEAVSGLSDSYEITSINPRQFRVTLSVPSSRWAGMPSNDLLLPKLEVRPDARKEDRKQEFSVTSAVLGLPSDIRIVRTEPENLREITVSWDYVIERDLPVEPPTVINVPTGFEAEVTLDVTLVKVRAAADVVEHEAELKNRVRFKPIDLGAIASKSPRDQVHTDELSPLATLPYKVQRNPIASVVLRPVPSSMVLPPLPVNVLAPRDALGRIQVDLSQLKVALTVRGPENLLKHLDPEAEVTAYVDLRRVLEPGLHELPISLLAPSWLAFDAMTVRVTVSPATPPPPVPTEPPGDVHSPPETIGPPSSDAPSSDTPSPPGGSSPAPAAPKPGGGASASP